MCNGLSFHVVICTTTSWNIGHLFLATMNSESMRFRTHVYRSLFSCRDMYYHLLKYWTLVFSHYEQVFRTQKVCVSGPKCNGLSFHVVICTTTSWNIGHLFLATMNKCIELRMYAFPDICLLDFLFLFWWVLPPLKIFDTYFFNIPYIDYGSE